MSLLQGRFAARWRGSYFAARGVSVLSGRGPGRRVSLTKIYLDLGRGGPWASCRQRPRSVGSDPQAQSLKRITCNFCKSRPQWAGRNRGKSLRICAPEVLHHLQGITPVKGGPGGKANMSAPALILSRPPGDPLVTFPSLGKSLAARDHVPKEVTPFPAAKPK